MTENTTQTDPSMELTVIPGGSGEVVNLRELTGAGLADLMENLDDAYLDLAAYKAELVREVARRADKAGARTATIDGVTFEVNAPTEEAYSVDVLREKLKPLVDAGELDASTAEALITRPKPKVEPERVDKRKLNVLKRSDNRRLLAALAAARTVNPTRRTAKVVQRVVQDGEA
jgi:hypothetical protein